MVGVGYGKGADLPEASVRWVSAAEVWAQMEASGSSSRAPLLLLDARDTTEFEAGTLPGATSLAQNALMFEREKDPRVRSILESVLADASREVVLFANTAGTGGMVAGRDVWVMAFFHELGVPLDRMARLQGGLNGWRQASLPVELPSRAGALGLHNSLEALLSAAGVPQHFARLDAAGETLPSCAVLVAQGRAAMLNRFSALGLGLADRHKLAGIFSKAVREGAFGEAASEAAAILVS